MGVVVGSADDDDDKGGTDEHHDKAKLIKQHNTQIATKLSSSTAALQNIDDLLEDLPTEAYNDNDA